jgi:dynein heavy chain, axonemal
MAVLFRVQDHYDYGMRAVKTTITAAGRLRLLHPKDPEEHVLLRALISVNLPKFFAHDVLLFQGILSDLFPGVPTPDSSDATLREGLGAAATSSGLQAEDAFVQRCLQLWETTSVRHGVMVIGPAGSGKSAIISTLSAAVTTLSSGVVENPMAFFPAVARVSLQSSSVLLGSLCVMCVAWVCARQISKHFVNPKSVTLGQLYGEFDASTREWNDGVLSRIVRLCSRDADMSQSAMLIGVPSPMNNPTITPKGSMGTMWSDESSMDVHHWIVLDGPVDPIWIENLNTVRMRVWVSVPHVTPA